VMMVMMMSTTHSVFALYSADKPHRTLASLHEWGVHRRQGFQSWQE